MRTGVVQPAVAEGTLAEVSGEPGGRRLRGEVTDAGDDLPELYGSDGSGAP
ncbi:hypothetical protein [Streptomyces sp. NPDC001450]